MKEEKDANSRRRAKLIGIDRHRLATDGMGVTTLVAFHGCPLRCQYCLNAQCLEPRYACLYRSVKGLIREVSIDSLYYVATGGGVTFGGGEPLLSSRFIREFCEQCPKEWKMAVETSLNVPLENVQEVSPYISEWIVDVKDMNPEIYKRYTGRDNRQVMENLKWLGAMLGRESLAVEGARMAIVTIRLPLIPGFNTEADRAESKKQLEALGFQLFELFEYQLIE